MIYESIKRMDIQQFNDVYDLIKNSNDRSAGVIAGALVEELLMQLISASVVDGLDESFQNSRSGPFSSLFSKTQIAYAFGLIGEEEVIWLDVIRNIRNNCAHHLTSGTNDIDFSKSPIIDHLREMLPQRWINKLDKANQEKILQTRKDIFTPKGAREMFNYLVSLTALALLARISTTERKSKPSSFSEDIV